MSPGQAAVLDLVAAVLVVCLAGIVVRGKVEAAPAFVVYLATALATNRLIAWWPELFFNRAFWGAKETVFAVLKLGIVLDIAARSLRAFPRARRLAQAGLATASILAIAGPLVAVHGLEPRVAILAAQAWMQGAAAWGFVALLAVASWYQLPLHPFHRAITLGAALYLAVYGTLLDVVAQAGYQPFLVALDPAAYAATCGMWAMAAWRRDASELGHSVAATLYPWVRS